MINEISVQELKAKMESGEDYILIDCREQNEYDEKRIEGTTLIPLSVWDEKFADTLKDESQQILIHCRSGKRSMTACQKLNDEGFESLTNIAGGILAWEEAGYPVIEG